MGVDEGNLQFIDYDVDDVILEESYPITIVMLNLLLNSVQQ